MYKIIFLLFFLFECCFAQVLTGIDVLIQSNFSQLHGKRIGLLTNPTGVSADLISTIDILAKAENVTLVALFGPEHGVRGDVTAGGTVMNSSDPVTGLPVYSLYGKTRKPTAEMLKGIDALVYDIQDIGTRSYTYINTMALAMEAASENNIEFIVLDRPDPLSGTRVEGSVLDTAFRSFVGQYPIPYVYGMTCGELATLLNNEGWLTNGERCRLTVIPMEGWKRSMYWEDTGLQWVPTSPHIPNAATALFYPATGILGELQTVNIGVGYTMPFQLIGAEWIDAQKFSDALNKEKIPGVWFRPIHYKPYYGEQQGKELHGIQIHLLDKARVNLTSIQMYVIAAIISMYPNHNPFSDASDSRCRMFDKVVGTDAVRNEFLGGMPADSIVGHWNASIRTFLPLREKYLLYK